jgi:hypothetical protein
MMDDEVREMKIGKAKRSVRRKSTAVQLCPLQIPQDHRRYARPRYCKQLVHFKALVLHTTRSNCVELRPSYSATQYLPPIRALPSLLPSPTLHPISPITILMQGAAS